VNSASQGPGLAPGCLADVIGTNLASSASTAAFVGTTPVATIVSASGAKWTILIPFGLQPGPTTVTIGTASFNITLAQYAPALFSLNQTGTGIVNAQGYPLTSVGSLIQPGYVLGAPNPASLGDLLVLNATGLGPIDPSNYNQTDDTPVVTVGGQSVEVTYAYMTTSPAGTMGDLTACDGPFCYAGMYQVFITLPPAIGTGNQLIVLTIDGVSTSQTLTVPINNIPIIKSIENAASGPAAFLAPGSLASIYGTTFGSTSIADPASTYPSTSLNGVSVTFNGIKAPLLYLGTAVNNSYGQINVQVPVELPASGTVNVQVTTGSGVSAATSAATVQMASAAPGVFWFYDANDSSDRSAAVVEAGTSWVVMPGALALEYGITGNCVSPQTLCAESAKPGDSVQIYVTGLGATSPPLGTGQLAPASGNPPYPAALTPTVTVGGIPAQVSFAGVAPGWYAGFYVIDIVVPATAPAGNFVPIAVSMPDGLMDTSTTIAIQ